jgi:hypothetical protein
MNVVLLGKREPNVRSLFAQNELGLAIDIGDRNGASEAKQTWRRNLLGYTEGTVAQLGTGSNVTDAVSSISGFSNSIAFVDNALTRFAYKVIQTVASASYTFSLFVQMDDDSAPVVGTNTTTGDLCLILESNFATSGITVSLVSGSIYRISGTVTGSGLTTRNFGAVKYTGQSAKGFRVTGYQLEIGSLSTYQPITDFNTEFKAAFPSHSLYVDSNGVAPAVYPGDQVGLVIDSSRGGLENLGAELVTNGGFDSDTWWTKSTNVTISGGLANYNTVALNNGVFRSGVVTAGKFYVVTFTVASFSSGGVRVYTGGNRTSTYAATGTYRVFCLAGSSDTQIIFEATSAGTVLALDNISVKEIPGIHPYQTTSGSRPALCRTPDGGRRNLLTYSEQFDVTSGGWVKFQSTISPNATTAPDGTLTADSLIDTVASQEHNAYQTATTTTATFSCYAKASGRSVVGLRAYNSASQFYTAIFDLSGGTVTLENETGTTFSGVSAAISDSGNGWYRCSITYTRSFGLTYHVIDLATSTTPTLGAGGSEFYTGNGTGIFIWGAQLETGSSATTYQRVTTTHDVTESGKRDCWGLLADGSDDSLITTSVDFNTWTAQTRRNLLVDTESFGTSSWTKTSSTVTENSEANPIESLSTADSIIEVAATSAHNVQQAATFTTSAVHTYSVYAKANGRNLQFVIPTAVVTSGYANFDLINGVVGDKSAGVTQQITSLGNGWYRCAIEFTAATGSSQTINLALITASNSARGQSYLGDGTSGIYLWGAQLELGTLTDYQRVGTDKMTVMAGVQKNSNAFTPAIIELSATSLTNNGSFHLGSGENNTGNYYLQLRGTSVNGYSPRIYNSPHTGVVSAQFNIAQSAKADEITARVNGVSDNGASVGTDAGTGNFGNYPIYIGRRNNAVLPFNGIIYTLIVRGAATPTGTIADFERNLLAKRAGVTF